MSSPGTGLQHWQSNGRPDASADQPHRLRAYDLENVFLFSTLAYAALDQFLCLCFGLGRSSSRSFRQAVENANGTSHETNCRKGASSVL